MIAVKNDDEINCDVEILESFKTIIRIPTVQFGYVEVEFLGNVDEIADLNRRLLSAIENKPVIDDELI